jgi:hypothetical protein
MIRFFEDRGIQATVTPDSRLNLKGLSGLSDESRQEVLFFARENKAAILSELKPPSPDLSQIQPGHTQEYITLWYSAWTLADYVDGGNATALYPDRVARLPKLNQIIKRMRDIEDSSMPRTPSQVKNNPVIPADYTDQDPDTCRACGQKQWWHKNEPNSKWICGRCHPPATGLDVILERI